MQSRQGQLIDTARNVQAFLDENAAVIGPTIASSRANLDDAVAQLTAMAVTQSGGKILSKGATARQKTLRTSLRGNFMKPIADVAKLKLGDVPEFGALTMPKKQLGSTQLVASAHAMADAAEPHAAVFIGVGLPDDFVSELRTAADAVTTSMNGRQVQLGLSRSATAGIKDQETRVRALFRLINALVVPKLGSNVVLLSKWKATKAITHTTVTPVPAVPATPVVPATPDTPAATTPAATPAATTTPTTTTSAAEAAPPQV
jgi:hypothetical protein